MVHYIIGMAGVKSDNDGERGISTLDTVHGASAASLKRSGDGAATVGRRTCPRTCPSRAVTDGMPRRRSPGALVLLAALTMAVSFVPRHAAAVALPKLTSVSAAQGVLDTELKVTVARWDTGVASMNTRCYDGKVPGPVWRVRAGDTIKINLKNELEGLGAAEAIAAHTPNRYGLSNVTNVHTHGMHVSPEGIADNVFLHTGPGESQQYVIPVPLNHGPGTHWFHAHVHMSTNLQVQNGLLGTIIVEDNATSVDPKLAAMREEVIVLQHVILDYTVTDTWPAALPVIEELSGSGFNLDLKVDEAASDALKAQHYTANGVHNPTVAAAPGELVRLRIVHAGHRAFLNLELAGDNSGACKLFLLANDGVYLDAPRSVDQGSNKVTFVPGSRRDVAVQCSAAGSFSIRSVAHGDLGANVYVGPLFLLEVSGDSVSPAQLLPTALPARPSYCPDLRGDNVDIATRFHVGFDHGSPVVNLGLVVGVVVTGVVLIAAHMAFFCLLAPDASADAKASRIMYAGLHWCMCRRQCRGHRARATAARTRLEQGGEDPHAPSASAPEPGALAVKAPFCNWASIAVTLAALLCWVLIPPAYLWSYPGWQINGRAFEGIEASNLATLTRGTNVQITVDSTDMMDDMLHPYHQHIVPAQVTSIPGGVSSWGGFNVGDWYDVVAAVGVPGGMGGDHSGMAGMGGGSAVVVPADPWTMRFVAADFVGHMVIHCHILAHEDLGMMAVAKIVDA